MTPARAAILVRAAELDDPYPLYECPGCHGILTGWPQIHTGHDSAPSPGTRVVWRNDNHPDADGVCPWDSDMLAARLHRRLLLAGQR